MGWDFYNDPRMGKAKTIEHCLAQSTWGESFTILRHSVVGNNLWIAVEKRYDDGTSKRFIALMLLRGGGRDSGWGYKAIDETMGPCEVNCPLYMLELVPDPQESYSTEWRKRVIEARANKRQRKTWEAGKTIALGNGRQYELLNPRTTWKGRKAGWIVKDVETGERYRVSAQQMARAEEVVNG